MKKTASLLMALMLCMSLSITAVAEEDAPIPVEDGIENISIKIEDTELTYNDLAVMKKWTRVVYDVDGNFDIYEVRDVFPGYCAVRRGTKFTVTNTSPAGSDTRLFVDAVAYADLGKGCLLYTSQRGKTNGLGGFEWVFPL